MTNLLPKKYKQQILWEYRIRRIAIALVLLCFTAIIAGIALFPSYTIVQQRYQEARDHLEELEVEAQEQEIQQHLSKLNQTNTLVDVLEPAESELRMYVILQSLLEHTSEGITLNEIAVEKRTKSENDEQQNEQDSEEEGSLMIQISLQGVADTRESLITFEKTLGEIEYINSVNLPVSNFASSEDISFSIDLEGSL